jgi:DNA repair protein RAD57
MSDLSQVLPDFPVARYARLLPAIEKNKLTVTDLLTLDVPEIGKRTQLPLLDVKRLCNAVLDALHADLGIGTTSVGARAGANENAASEDKDKKQEKKSSSSLLRQTGTELLAHPWNTISTLDAALDAALGGGVPTGYITEITGESGAGKTQFLLTLLLSAQLPPPHGLGRPALYISTEAALSTKRLSQILAQHPFFRTLDVDVAKPTLDGVISTVTPDLESQDHILTYQVPVVVARRDVGLIVLDSVAANYRAEFERGSGGSNMAARSVELARLGRLLRELARKHNLAVVVANQVADRFSNSNPFPFTQPQSQGYLAVKNSNSSNLRPSIATPGPQNRHVNHPHHHHPFGPMSQESPLASRSRNMNPTSVDASASTIIGEPEPTSSNMADIPDRSSMPSPPPPPPPEVDSTPAPPVLSLDHQQRWFTGWGDDPYGRDSPLKTPSLGLVWSTQIAARIALLRRPFYGRKEVVDDQHHHREGAEGEQGVEGVSGSAGPYIKSWRRYMKVVFAPHVPGAGPGLRDAVEFEIMAGGLRGVEKAGGRRKKKKKEEGG